jgi:hypothetical protein
VLLKERIPAYLGDWWLPHCDDKGRSTEDDEVAIGIERDERELVVFDRSFLRNASSESALAHPDLLCSTASSFVVPSCSCIQPVTEASLELLVTLSQELYRQHFS